MLASATVLVIATTVSFFADGPPRDGDEKPFTADQVQFFETQVRPILKSRCLKCHGDGPKIRAGFRLDSRSAVLKGGDLGPAVTASEPDKSRLLQAIRYEDDTLEMPPAGKLPAGEIEVLTRWVKEGLPWSPLPAVPAAGAAGTGRAPAATRTAHAARDAWSLLPVSRPPVPRVNHKQWCKNPIDAFLLARLEAEGLQPALRGRSRDLDPAAQLRPDRAAADPRGGRRLRRRSRCGRL